MTSSPSPEFLRELAHYIQEFGSDLTELRSFFEEIGGDPDLYKVGWDYLPPAEKAL